MRRGHGAGTPTGVRRRPHPRLARTKPSHTPDCEEVPACAMGSEASTDGVGARWLRRPACAMVNGMQSTCEVDESTDRCAVAHTAARVTAPVSAEPTQSDCIAVAYDGSGASAAAATFAARLASERRAGLTVIHVLADPRSCGRPVLPMHRAVREIVDAALPGERIDLRHVSAYRLPAAHLAHTIAAVGPALLVVPAPPRASWRTVLRRSIAAQVLRTASRPIVVVAQREIASPRSASTSSWPSGAAPRSPSTLSRTC